MPGCSDDDDENTPPIAVADTATTTEDRAVDINVLANDTDADDDDLTVTITAGPTNGTAIVNDDNTVTYTPNANFNGRDTFTYTADEGNDGTDAAIVAVTVISDAVAATAAALSNQAFVFADGGVFGIAPALGATTLTFGQFVGDTAPFVLETANRIALGTTTLASCDLQVASSTFIGVQGPQAGDRIALNPCLVDALDNGALTITNIDNVTATSGPSSASERIILPATLDGGQENPPVDTDATGTGILTVNAARDTIDFTLTYQGITTNALMAHIHAGPRGQNGGIIFFLCADTLPAGVGPCPEPSATLSGTLTEENFIRTDNPTRPVTTFRQAILAIRTGNTYFNVHSEDSPGGEIRGQVENPE
jgi:hypothetical protein